MTRPPIDIAAVNRTPPAVIDGERSLAVALACLFGLAVGDALGAPVEFLSRMEIEERYGSAGIQKFEPWGGHPAGSYTDDTQMSLATARGIVRAVRTGGEPAALVHEEYEIWLATQDDPDEARAPGATCVAVLSDGVRGTLAEAINESKGCGGAMRTAPVGIVYLPGDAFRVGAELAAITHGHPSGYLPGGFIAETIAHLRLGKTLARSISSALRVLQTWPRCGETADRIGLARTLLAGGVSPARALPALGQGWTGDEAIGLAVYCALKAAERLSVKATAAQKTAAFRRGVLMAVNITGDSDSTGSITGALLGTALGFEAIPKEWVRHV